MSNEKSVGILASLCAVSFSPLAAFKTGFPLSVIFSSLVMMCLGVIYFVFIPLKLPESVDLWFSSDSENCSHCFFSFFLIEI